MFFVKIEPALFGGGGEKKGLRPDAIRIFAGYKISYFCDLTLRDFARFLKFFTFLKRGENF